MGREADFGAVLRGLAGGRPRPLYVVVGDDAGLRARAVEAIRRAALGSEPPTAHRLPPTVVTFGPPDPSAPSSQLDVARIMDEIRSASLFAPRKLVVVRGADALLAAPRGGAGAGDDRKPPAIGAPLLEYLKAPVAGNTLVLEAEKLDARTALFKALEKLGAVVSCPRLYDTLFGETAVSLASSLGQYLAERARERGLQLAPEAGRRLLELAGGQAGRLDAELEKLAGCLGPGRKAALADVEALAAHGATDADDVVLAALAGRAADALRAAEEAFARGLTDFTGRLVWDERSIALVLVASLGRRVFDAERAALSGGTYAAKGKLPPAHVARAVEAAARRWRGAAVERAYRRVLEAEAELKSVSGRGGREILEDLVLELAGAPSAAAAPRTAR